MHFSALPNTFGPIGSVLEEIDLSRDHQAGFRLVSDFDAPAAARPRPLPVRVAIDGYSARQGGSLLLYVPLRTSCPSCDGSAFHGPFSCAHCAGTGRVDVDVPLGLRIPENAPDGFQIQALLRHLGVKDAYLSVTLDIS